MAKNVLPLAALLFFSSCNFYIANLGKRPFDGVPVLIYVKPVLNNTSWSVIEYFFEDNLKAGLASGYDMVSYPAQANIIIEVDLYDADYYYDSIRDENNYHINNFLIRANVTIKPGTVNYVKKINEFKFQSVAWYKEDSFNSVTYQSDIEAGFDKAAKILANRVVDKIDNIFYSY